MDFLRWVWRALSECEGPGLGEEGRKLLWRPFTPISNPPHPPKALYTSLSWPYTPTQGRPHQSHTLLFTSPRCSLSTLDLPDQFQYLSPTQAPSHPAQPISNTSYALHSHKSLQCLYQTLHTPLEPFTPIPSPPDPIKALHIHIGPSILILGLKDSSLAL